MFLLGVAVPSLEKEKDQLEFYSFARVGSGFSDEQLLNLLKNLDPHWQKWDKNAPPLMIHCGREKPDVWINPSSSAILEVNHVFELSKKLFLSSYLNTTCRSKHQKLFRATLTKSDRHYGFQE